MRGVRSRLAESEGPRGVRKADARHRAGAESRPPADGEGISLPLLDLFVRVHKTGSISAAARELNLSPSLATRRLAALERAMQTRLFERTTRSVRPTQAGRGALEWAAAVVDGYAGVSDDIASLQGEPRGLIRISMSEYAATVFLPPFLAEFAALHPAIRYAVSTTDLLVNPASDGYDVVIHSGRVPDSSLVGVHVRSVQRVLCASPQYLARRGVPDTPAALARHACLVHAPTEPSAWSFQHGDVVLRQAVDPWLSADSYLSLIDLARRGLGIARISRNTVREDLRAGRLVQVLPGFRCVYETGELPGVWILYPSRRMMARTRVFVDAFARYLDRVLE
jgi:DNA-binding transcriptional LysR family regulator